MITGQPLNTTHAVRSERPEECSPARSCTCDINLVTQLLETSQTYQDKKINIAMDQMKLYVYLKVKNMSYSVDRIVSYLFEK